MVPFQYHLPINVVFGRGRADSIGKWAAALGKRALIVTGGSSTKRSGLLQKTQDFLRASGVSSVVFDDVSPNPLTTTVYEGAELAARERIDVVIGLGGGSSLDTAKGIAFHAMNGGNINDFIFGRRQSDRALPLIALPTTCGTGSEGNGFAVMTNPETRDKKSLRCNAIIPACSIIDPLLMTTLPKPVLASVGFDAFCHNFEAFLSRVGSPFTVMQALEGLRLSARSLIRVYKDPSDLNGWDDLCLASLLGGMVIHAAGVTAAHSMEHPASGLRNIVHGRGLAALTPVICEESAHTAPEKYAAVSRLLGGKDEGDCAERIRTLLDTLELSTALGEQGITDEDVDWLATNCIRVGSAGLANHPVHFGTEDLKRLYRKAL